MKSDENVYKPWLNEQSVPELISENVKLAEVSKPTITRVRLVITD